MKTLKRTPVFRRRKAHQADISNPLDYKSDRRPLGRPEERGGAGQESDAAMDEEPYPGRDELSPGQRPKGDSSAGSPLSAI